MGNNAYGELSSPPGIFFLTLRISGCKLVHMINETRSKRKWVALDYETWGRVFLLAKQEERSLRVVIARLARHECERLGLIASNGQAPADADAKVVQDE